MEGDYGKGATLALWKFFMEREQMIARDMGALYCPTSGQILLYVGICFMEGRQCDLTCVASAINVSTQTVSRKVAKLVKAGWLEYDDVTGNRKVLLPGRLIHERAVPSTDVLLRGMKQVVGTIPVVLLSLGIASYWNLLDQTPI